MQVVLKLMEKRLQQLQSTEKLARTELPTMLWALQYGISTYFEVHVTDIRHMEMPMQKVHV